MAKDPNKIAEKWASRLESARSEIESGVNAVTEPPGAKAAAVADFWLARLTAAKDKWKRRTAAVTLEQWKTAFTSKIDRISSGARASMPQFASFMNDLMNYINQNLPQLNKPELQKTGSLERSKARAAAWIEIMSKFKRG